MTLVGPRLPPRENRCAFYVFSTQPAGGFMEIGTVDVTGIAIRTLDEFKAYIRQDVCGAGGDAAIAWANGDGLYLKATILKGVLSQTPAAAPLWQAPAAAPPPVASGCQYDTQCKGDRICVSGACAAPAGK